MIHYSQKVLFGASFSQKNDIPERVKFLNMLQKEHLLECAANNISGNSQNIKRAFKLTFYVLFSKCKANLYTMVLLDKELYTYNKD